MRDTHPQCVHKHTRVHTDKTQELCGNPGCGEGALGRGQREGDSHSNASVPQALLLRTLE